MATISQILAKVDELKPHQYEDAVMIGWLGSLEQKILDEVILTHELPEGEEPEFNGYTDDDMGTELLVPDPYSELYIYYLFAMIDFHNGETERYGNSMIMYNNAFSSFFNHYNRTHKPISAPVRL
jgi:hypothetical protein